MTLMTTTGSEVDGSYSMNEAAILGMVISSVLATFDCVMAASRREYRCAISTSVFAKLMALLNSSMALSRLPLEVYA